MVNLKTSSMTNKGKGIFFLQILLSQEQELEIKS